LQKQFLFTGIEGTGFARSRGMRGRAYENPKTRCNDEQVCKNQVYQSISIERRQTRKGLVNEDKVCNSVLRNRVMLKKKLVKKLFFLKAHTNMKNPQGWFIAGRVAQQVRRESRLMKWFAKADSAQPLLRKRTMRKHTTLSGFTGQVE